MRKIEIRPCRLFLITSSMFTLYSKTIFYLVCHIDMDKINNIESSSIGAHKERKYDTFNFRMEFIKELLGGKKLEPLI